MGQPVIECGQLIAKNPPQRNETARKQQKQISHMMWMPCYVEFSDFHTGSDNRVDLAIGLSLLNGRNEALDPPPPPRPHTLNHSLTGGVLTDLLETTSITLFFAVDCSTASTSTLPTCRTQKNQSLRLKDAIPDQAFTILAKASTQQTLTHKTWSCHLGQIV